MLAAVDQADAAPGLVTAVVVDQLDELVGGRDRIPGDTQRPRQHVGRAAGHHRDRGEVCRRRRRTGVAEQAVDHPAHRAVAAVHDDQVDPVRGGSLPEFVAVTAVVGVFDGELQAALERMCQKVASRRRGGSGRWVHDQHRAHDARAYAGRLSLRCGGTARSPGSAGPPDYADAVTTPAPSAVRGAGLIVALQGAAALVMAAVLVVRAIAGADQRVVNGLGTAVWFIVVGGVVLAAGRALALGKRWGRGLAVFAQLLLLPVAWYLTVGSHQPVFGIPVGLVALTVLILLFSPSAVRWASGGDQRGSASSDNGGPDTR